ncbi:MAG: phenol hydroxylase subunit P4 [Candidatus Symbiobacter sp.]|nr:phenol hydroxylase subunit P4 [Candidatus Symbiobacter sp.]
MTTKTHRPYYFVARDQRQNFATPIFYLGWIDHAMYCAPICLDLPLDMKFGDFVTNCLPQYYGQHPDFAAINWSQVHFW